MQALRVLAAVFDIDTGVAEKKLRAFDGTMKHAKSALATLATSVVGAFSVGMVKNFIQDQIELGSKINDTAEKLGVTTEQLQKFQFAAGLSGVEAESAAQALGFLNKNIGAAITGGAEQADTFRKLGIVLKNNDGVRELNDIVPEVADAFAKLGSDQERTALSMQLFGKSGASLIPLLKQGSGELAKLSGEFDALGGGLDDAFIKKADEAGDEIDKLKFAMTGLKSRVAVAVLPTVTEFAKKLQGMAVFAIKLAKETRIVKEGIALLGVVAAAAGVQAAAGWAKFFGLVPKGGSIWKTLLNMGELGLIIAGVAVLFLLFEDFFTFLNGGKSVIGALIEQFLGLETAKTLLADINSAADLLAGLFATDLGTLAPLVDLFKSLGKEVIPFVLAGFVDMVRVIAGGVVALGAFVKGFAQLTQLDFAGAGKTLSATTKVLGELLSKSSVGDLAIHAKANAAYVPEAPIMPYYGNRGGGEPTSISQTNQTTINVNGGATNAETGRVVAGAVRGVLDANSLRQAAAAVPRGPGT